MTTETKITLPGVKLTTDQAGTKSEINATNSGEVENAESLDSILNLMEKLKDEGCTLVNALNLLFHQFAKIQLVSDTILSIYSERPKSKRSNFGTFQNCSVVESFGFQTFGVSLTKGTNGTNSLDFRYCV